MITLFTSARCPQCVRVKMALNKANISYQEEPILSDLSNLTKACKALGIDAKRIKSSPVLITDTSIWSGEDCIVAIENEEVCEN